jgi:two-component system, OmpR family, phosphate regulon sensor histidine kinase PhoR
MRIGLPQWLVGLMIGCAAVLSTTVIFWVAVGRSPHWVAVVAGLICTSAAAWGIIEWTIYSRIRLVERRVRSVFEQRGLKLFELSEDPIRNIYSGLAELIVVTRREMVHLQELEKFRRDFIGDVSHELKTPLFAIQGFIDTLLDGALDDKTVNRKFLQQAHKNTERLSTLVHDLMTISQLDSGELQMNHEPFILYDLILDVADLLDYKIAKKGRNVRFKLVALGLERTEVFADSERIRQVLYNLIDNAIKYGNPEGVVEVVVKEAENHKIRVLVKDDGPGIADEHLPFLFGRFYRVEKSRSRDMGGTGLGLSIVKKLVEAHAEQIHVSSEPGKGTTFEFTLARPEGSSKR